jgi:hypothetical protein
MEIRFCTVCNESIPDSDFDSGRALVSGAESLHVACALRRSLEGRGVGRVLVMLLALYAAAVSTFLLVGRRGDGASREPGAVPEATRAFVEAERSALEKRVTGWIDARAGDVRREVVEELAPRLRDELSRKVEEQARKTEENLAANTRILHDRLNEFANRLARDEEQLAEVNRWRIEIQQLAERLTQVLESGQAAPTPAAGGARPTPTPGTTGPESGGTTAPPPVDPGREELITKWIDRLKDADDDVVFTSTIELARLKALRAAPDLVQVLEKHKDFYARLGAATALGEIPAVDGVPALIEALADRDDLVRTAANEALKRITGQDFNFSSQMSKNERTRIQRQWKQWWKDNEPEVRRRHGQ